MGEVFLLLFDVRGVAESRWVVAVVGWVVLCVVWWRWGLYFFVAVVWGVVCGGAWWHGVVSACSVFGGSVVLWGLLLVREVFRWVRVLEVRMFVWRIGVGHGVACRVLVVVMV